MRIVAPTDFSESGRRVVDLAVELARATGAEMEVIHVACLPPEPSQVETGADIQPALQVFRQRVQRRMEHAADQLQQERTRATEAGVSCTSRLLQGHPWEVIVEEAERSGADLLVVGPHGLHPPRVLREHIRERLLGTTADRVVRHAPCPVLVATGEREAIPLSGRRWLVGTDFSPASLEALRFAHRLADACDGKLVLAHVIPPTGIEDATEVEPTWQQLLREESRKLASAELRALAEAEATGAGVYQEDRLSHGPPAEELCHAVDEMGADFLVVGTHGRKGLSRLLLGSTAERCLRRAPVPVLVVPPVPEP